MSGIIGTILLVLLIGITVFNIYATATKKKRDGSAKVRYDALFSAIENEILKSDSSWNTAKVKRIVTEDEQGILAALDDEKRRAVIGWQGGTFPFSYDDYIGSELNDEKGLILTVRTKNDALDLTLSEGKFRKNGSACKPVKDMGRIMMEFLDTIQTK